jgi:hypothetical protein
LDTRTAAISVNRYGKRLVVGQRKSPEPAVGQPRCAVDRTITGDQSGTVLVCFSGRGCAAQYLRHVASDRSDLRPLPF